MHGVQVLSGNMIVSMCMASPSMFCRFVARESMESLSPSIDPVGSVVMARLGESPRLVRIALAAAIACEVGEWESFAISNF